jgi:predicted DNA-binding protein
MNKNKRTQILLTEKQYKKLHALSEHEKKSIGFLIREAVDIVYIKEKKNREKIVEKIAAMNLPSGDWEEIKKEIIKDKNK